MLIWFSCFINYINFRIHWIEFYCSISFCSSCISFKILNVSNWMLYTIALRRFQNDRGKKGTNARSHIPHGKKINFFQFPFPHKKNDFLPMKNRQNSTFREKWKEIFSISLLSCGKERDCLLISLLNDHSDRFLSTLISSNLKRFFDVFRCSINFWAFKFSVVTKTMYCSMRENYIVCTNTSTFLYNFSAPLILFRYSIALIVEIWFFWSYNYLSTQLNVKFCRFCKKKFSCILALFVIFRDITCVYKFNDDAFFIHCNLWTIWELGELTK